MDFLSIVTVIRREYKKFKKAHSQNLLGSSNFTLPNVMKLLLYIFNIFYFTSHFK